MNSEILIFGASGFLGRHVCRHFVLEFETDKLIYLSKKDVDLCDKQRVNAYANKYGDVSVVFLAGLSPYHGVEQNIFEKNVAMLENVVEAFGSKLKHIVYTSTTDVYGKPDSVPITEQRSLNPQSWYAKSKLEAELFLGRLPRDIKVTIFRMASIYGEFDDGKRAVVGRIKNAILNGERLKIVGSGQQIRDLTYADDIARVLGVALRFGIIGTYNLVSGYQYSINQITDILANALNVTPKKEYGIQGEEQDFIFDNNHLSKTFLKINFRSLNDVVTRLISPSLRSGINT